MYIYIYIYVVKEKGYILTSPVVEKNLLIQKGLYSKLRGVFLKFQT